MAARCNYEFFYILPSYSFLNLKNYAVTLTFKFIAIVLVRMLKLLFSLSYLKFLLISLFLIFTSIGCSASEPVSGTIEERHNLDELEALYRARIDSSRMNFVQADVDFMTGMISHHAQALIMSRLAPENGASPAVQTLAARIINAQGDEIELMQRWLGDRDQPVPEVHTDGLVLMIGGLDDHGHHGHGSVHHHHNMPGMLTQAQLEELAEAHGREFDKKFLEFMIEHHQGAVIMVQELFNAEGAASGREAFDLASGIHAEQVTEIERMKRMLEAIQ